MHFSCAPSRKFTKDRWGDAKPSVPVEQKRYRNYSVVETVKGVASFYADKYHGRLTSNGEIYDMYGLTAAHPSYPHETIIRVTNLSNGKSVVVRVNDRMPYREDRIIDLSYGTAIELDMVEDGIVEVKLEILEWGEE
ncbi:septal ring lytic transglycosylase RlpA family protein [Bacteroidota bacterium]